MRTTPALIPAVIPAAGLAVIGLAATAALVLPGASATAAQASQASQAAPSSAAAATVAGVRAAAETTTETTIERGIVLECTGAARGIDASVTVYENDRHRNYLQVVVGEGRGSSSEPADLWRGHRVSGVLRVDGARAVVAGTAKVVGAPRRVREELDDAGQHITSVGTHRRVRTNLALSYDGVRVPLTCDTAFTYRLRVTRTDITG